MGVCLFKMEHDCGSSDGLQVYEDLDGKNTGYCWSCDTYVPDPLGKRTKEEVKALKATSRPTKTKKEIKQDMKFIAGLGCMDLRDRKLRKETLNHFDVKIGLSEYDGTSPAFAYFPYTKKGKVVRYKVKMLASGKVWSVGLDNDVDLFGWQQALESGARKLIVTEGEFDAVALTKIFEMKTKDEYKHMMPAIVSLPNGAASAARDLTRLLPKIRKHFKEVALCFDDDKAGDAAVEAVCKMAPDMYVIELPLKDANECLVEGYSNAAFKSAQWNAAKPKNSRIIWAEDVHEGAKVKPKWGLSWPWKGMTELTRGIRGGETIYLGAGEKMGKGEIVHSLIAHLVKKHGEKVLLCSPEESNNKSYKLMANKLTGKIFHDPKREWNEEAFEEAGRLLRQHVAMIDLRQHIDWDNLKQDIMIAASQGVKHVFIDPITNLTPGLSPTEVNTALSGVSPELSAIAKDLDITAFIFCHLNKPSDGSWDRGKRITTNYFAGSSAMARSCNYALGLEGNKDPEKPELHNIRELIILSDREFGEAGSVKLYWDKRTALFNEMT